MFLFDRRFFLIFVVSLQISNQGQTSTVNRFLPTGPLGTNPTCVKICVIKLEAQNRLNSIFMPYIRM
uniref:Putative secreted protein n=1 Tax=Anopheles triannulatus TaxID=58253 RepID=A0A2M4B6X5_9DIPT